MTIMRSGLNWVGKPLFEALDEDALGQTLVEALQRNLESVTRDAKTTQEGIAFKGEIDRRTLDPGDPLVAGWTYLVNGADAQCDAYAQALEPLAAHRGMADSNSPLRYGGEPIDEWLTDRYFALELEGKQAPQYVLIVGGPDQVPFRFQSVLDTVSNVGRVDLPLDDLKTYVDKLIRLEDAPEPVVDREAVLFAPDGGITDPTYFSREYMVQPIGKHIRDEVELQTHELLGLQATKEKLLQALRTKSPALVYTASHGLGATDQSDDIQRRYNGAICCQHTGPLTLDHLFSADDVPMGEPFLEGAAFFEFACFGYGTPAESDYTHWIDDMTEAYTSADFVAALPKRLLAHPQGPIAFISHLDTAFLHAFTDQNDPFIMDRWHARIAPFVSAVNMLLGVQPSGLAMGMMNQKYIVTNAMLTNTYDRQQRGRIQWTESLVRRFVDTWIIRGDAQNYMVFGDPAARLRIPD